MNDLPYLIPAQPAQFEEEIKKSVFITYLAHTPSVEAAKAFVEQIKTKHADARHNCWGFVAGRPEDSMKWGFSDDGWNLQGQQVNQSLLSCLALELERLPL